MKNNKVFAMMLMVPIVAGTIFTGNPATAGGGTIYWPIAGKDTTGGSAISIVNGISSLLKSDDIKLAHDLFWPTSGNFDESKFIEFDFSNQASTFSDDYKIDSAKIQLEFNTNNAPLSGAKIEVFDASGDKHEHTLLMPAVGADVKQTIDISSYLDSREKGKSFKVRFLAHSASATQTLFDEVRLDVSIKKKKEKSASREISNSKDKLRKGDFLVQQGSNFSKKSEVKLYFAKSDGSYYDPQIVSTDKNGDFTVSYKVNKSKGKYKWYAVDTKSGKKSKTISYTVK